jgi:hypothetical protein
LKNLILTQKKIAIEKKTNPIVVANKKSDIKKAEEGKVFIIMCI